MSVSVLTPVLLDLSLLRPYDGPALKKPIAPRTLRALRASIREFGFSGTLNVAADDGGIFTTLDGNTRLEELQAAGIPACFCYVHDDLAWNVSGAEGRRKQFVIAFDNSRKQYDTETVLGELKDLVAKGADIKRLADLSGVEKLKRIVEESKAGAEKAMAGVNTAAVAPVSAQESMILYGPVTEIAKIKDLLASIRGKFTMSAKVAMALEQAHANLDIEDEQFLACFMSSLGAFQKQALSGG